MPILSELRARRNEGQAANKLERTRVGIGKCLPPWGSQNHGPTQGWLCQAYIGCSQPATVYG